MRLICRLLRVALHDSRSALMLLVALSALLIGCAATARPAIPTPTEQQQVQLGLTPGALDATPPPSGWYRVLNGQTFIGDSTVLGLAVSAARPSRLAGCALPVYAHSGTKPDFQPVFLLSDDQGRSWQKRHIIGAPKAQGCQLFADPQQPDTFVVVATRSNASPPFAAITTNAGHSWRVISPPIQNAVIDTRFQQGALVAGYFFAGVNTQPSSLTERRTPTGAWQIIAQSSSPLVVAPSDPNRIYTITGVASPLTGAIDSSEVLVTDNAGATWHVALHVPGIRIIVQTAPGGRVYVQQLESLTGSPYQLYYSSDNGQTWQGTAMQDPTAQMFIGPTGRVILVENAGGNSSNQLYTFDPVSAKFTLLGAMPNFPHGAMCVITEGARPTLYCGDDYDTYARPLPLRF
jgi:hypothetical protein